MIDDVWYEILVRIDPSFIFNCIVICKAWLKVITSYHFRRSYQKRWKSNSKLVGFLTRHATGSKFGLLACSKLGQNINMSSRWSGIFISKSGNGDGLVLYGLLPGYLYVSKPGKNLIQLPQPDESLKLGHGWVTNAILTKHNSYRVIAIAYHNDHCDNIYTFCSSTRKWDYSKPLVHHSSSYRMDFFPCGQNTGIGCSSKGLVYWPHRGADRCTWVGVYDDNNEDVPMTWVGGWRFDDGFQNYGLSPEGHLLLGTSPKGFGNKISIWWFSDDKQVWHLLHSVLPHPIPRKFDFMSFIPGTCDSIVVQSGGRLFIFDNHNTDELDTSTPLVDHEVWKEYGTAYSTPLTMADLGVWPSSPFSKNTSSTYHIKHLLDLS